MDACFKDERCAGKVLWISDRNKSVAEIPRQRVRELRSSGLMPLDAYPLPPRSIGITEMATKRELNY